MKPGSSAAASPSGITSAYRPSPNTPWSRANPWSRSTAHCPSRKRRCSAAPSLRARARSSTPRRCPPGTTVAVVGLGGVGLMSMLAARLSGCRQIVAIDMLDDKLALAKQLGATHTVKRERPQMRRAREGPDPGRRRFRLRDGQLCQGAGARLQNHTPRRHHGDRLPAASNAHHGASWRPTWLPRSAP